GFETYIYNGSVSSKTKQFQDVLHKTIAAGCGLKDRGKKRANYQVLRNTVMPAVLTENDFIDTKSDAAKMKGTSWVKKMGRLHAAGILKFLHKKPVKATHFYPALTAAPKPSNLDR